jgi:cytochrome b involved in lipid metabolism
MVFGMAHHNLLTVFTRVEFTSPWMSPWRNYDDYLTFRHPRPPLFTSRATCSIKRGHIAVLLLCLSFFQAAASSCLPQTAADAAAASPALIATRRPPPPSPWCSQIAATTMPGRTLPTFTVAQVAAHKSAKSCFVTVGRNVYDVTDFLDSHPGGSDLVLEYGGKDVSDILKDGASSSRMAHRTHTRKQPMKSSTTRWLGSWMASLRTARRTVPLAQTGFLSIPGRA